MAWIIVWCCVRLLARRKQVLVLSVMVIAMMMVLLRSTFLAETARMVCIIAWTLAVRTEEAVSILIPTSTSIKALLELGGRAWSLILRPRSPHAAILYVWTILSSTLWPLKALLVICVEWVAKSIILQMVSRWAALHHLLRHLLPRVSWIS